MHVPQSATGSDLERVATQNMSLERLSELLEDDFSKSRGDETGRDDISGTDVDLALAMDFKPESQASSVEHPSGPSLTSQSPGNDDVTQDTPRDNAKNVLKPPVVSGVRVMEELGRRGMGVVYRAHDEKLKADVALKTLLRMGPDDLARFKHEFRGLSDIAHPNLASLYELHSDGTTWCLTMELLKGVEFLEYIWSELEALDTPHGHAPAALPSSGTLRLTEPRLNRLRDAIRQLAIGLNELHRAGKLHSDIKPSNVFVTTEGRLVLLDFGLIAEITRDEDGRMPKAIQGTPPYMAPEQAACRQLTAASDWYAVGVMLYEVLTGRLPFEGSRVKVMLRKQMEIPIPPNQRRDGIPLELNDLCMKLLAIEPADRPTVTEVLHAIGADTLADHLDGTSTAVVTVDLVGRERQFDVLNQSLAEVMEGATRSVFVHGFSGMGKSVLINTFLDRLRRDDETILLEGRCYEQESVPFKALDSLIDALALFLSELAPDESARLMPQDTLPLVRLFPVFGQVPGAADETGKPTIAAADQNELRQRAVTSLRELLTEVSIRRSVVLYIDDLQWGDDDSSNVLADLVRPPECPPLLLLGSYRREDVGNSSALKTLTNAYQRGKEHPHRYDLAVDKLSTDDASRLALMLIGQDSFESQKIAERIASESGGSPFFVWELAQHVKHDTASALGTLELDEVIWSRVTRMPIETRRLLEVFAVSGRPMSATEAYETIDIANGPSLLAQLRTNGFIRTTEREGQTLVETYHDRIRESVVDHLSATKVSNHNLSIAEVIEQECGFTQSDIDQHIRSTPDFEEPGRAMALSRRQWQRVSDLAWFFDAAGQTERALPYALIAAERAWAQNAYEVAEQQFDIARRGAEIQLSRPALRFRIAEGLGDVLVMRGKYDRGNLHLETARQLAEGNLVQARVDSKRGWVGYKTGDMDSSSAHFHRALKATGSPVPSNMFKQLLAVSREGAIQILHTCFPRTLTGNRSPSTAAGSLELFRAALHDGLGYPYFFSRRPVPVLWTHLRHMNLAEKYRPGQELGRAYAYHAVVMTAIPMAERGARYADRAYEIHTANGDRFGQGQARSFKTMSLTTAGRFREAVENGREAVRLLDEAGDVWEANMARILVSVPTYYLGQLEEACRTAQTVLRVGYDTGDYMAVACAVLFGTPTAPHCLPEGTIESELKRERCDPLSTSAVIQARGLEKLIREDNPIEAAKWLKDGLDYAWRKMFRNPYIYCGYAWRAEALRVVAEREPKGASQRKAIKAAIKAARTALWITKLYHTSRAQALREMGTLLAMQGRAEKAHRYFDESIRVGKSQDATYELAKTRFFRGRAGVQFGWEDAEQEYSEAEREISRITAFW